MRIKYFQDTDTLYIEFRATDVAETRDLDENTLLEIDREGQICGITVEHASDRTGIPAFSFEQVSSVSGSRSGLGNLKAANYANSAN